MMRKKPYLIWILAWALWSCKDETKASRNLIESHNHILSDAYESGEDWVFSPLSIAIKLSGAGEVSSETVIKMRRINKGERATEVEIVINEKGVLDDSDSRARSKFYLKLKDNRWVVVE